MASQEFGYRCLKSRSKKPSCVVVSSLGAETAVCFCPVLLQAASISQLPLSLLARILACLEPAERLDSAALVSTAWRTAAVLGTDRITWEMKVSGAAPAQFDSLSAWLAINSHAGITELNTTMPLPAPSVEHMPVVQLPSLQRLPGLKCLHFHGVAITAAQGSSNNSEAAAQPVEAPPVPLQLSAATALTGLQFYSCNVTVEGMAALTRLQDLTLGTPLNHLLPDAVTFNLRTQLQQALPQLQVPLGSQWVRMPLLEPSVFHMHVMSRP
jgi:hypothetical protein